jgi:phospholipid transport system transporter-binding protein
VTDDAFALEQSADGSFLACGRMTYANAAAVLENGLGVLRASQTCIVDLTAVQETDSAGLAVLLEWRADAIKRGASLRYRNIPAQILAVARISEVQSLLIDS